MDAKEKRRINIDELERRDLGEWTIIRHEAIARIQQQILEMNFFDPNRGDQIRKMTHLQMLPLEQFKQVFLADLRSR